MLNFIPHIQIITKRVRKLWEVMNIFMALRVMSSWVYARFKLRSHCNFLMRWVSEGQGEPWGYVQALSAQSCLMTSVL